MGPGRGQPLSRRNLATGLWFLFSLMVAGSVHAQEARTLPAGMIKGTITNQDGAPLVFVTVALTGTVHTTNTDAQGTYELRDVPPGDYTLRISTLGYVPVEQSITVPERAALLVDARLRAEPSAGRLGAVSQWQKPGQQAADTYATAAKNAATIPFALIDGNTAFALDLYRALAAESSGNIAISPLSVSICLALLSAGAGGSTATELARVLRLYLLADDLHVGFAKLNTYLQALGKSGSVKLNLAQAVWLPTGTPVDSTFNALATLYGAPVRFEDPADMQPEPYEMRVVQDTQFLGEWQHPFAAYATVPLPFWVTPDSSVSARMMGNTATLRYAATETAQIVELPYRGDLVTMTVIVPRERDGLAAVETALTQETLREALAQLEPRSVHVTLPRFQVDWGQSLIPALQSLGLHAAFTDAAGFDGIAEEIRVNRVDHSAMVEVTETGTRAAAITRADEVSSDSTVDDPTPEIIADHPFLFLIRDLATGSILFLGRITDPS